MKRLRHNGPDYPPHTLSYEEVALLGEIIEPGHAHNPWMRTVQLRNCMIVRACFELRIRHAEVLNLRIGDLDLDRNMIIVRRLSPGQRDSRLLVPEAQGAQRMQRISESLAGIIAAYIVHDRQKLKGAREHDFLAVSHRDGAPLTQASLSHIFAAIANKMPGLPRLTVGMLRHRFALEACSPGGEQMMHRSPGDQMTPWLRKLQSQLSLGRRPPTIDILASPDKPTGEPEDI